MHSKQNYHHSMMITLEEEGHIILHYFRLLLFISLKIAKHDKVKLRHRDLLNILSRLDDIYDSGSKEVSRFRL